MSQISRYTWARVSYWLLFILAPVTVMEWLGGSGVRLGLFVLLVLVGEHGFRPWKRLWKVG